METIYIIMDNQTGCQFRDDNLITFWIGDQINYLAPDNYGRVASYHNYDIIRLVYVDGHYIPHIIG